MQNSVVMQKRVAALATFGVGAVFGGALLLGVPSHARSGDCSLTSSQGREALAALGQINHAGLLAERNVRGQAYSQQSLAQTYQSLVTMRSWANVTLRDLDPSGSCRR